MRTIATRASTSATPSSWAVGRSPWGPQRLLAQVSDGTGEGARIGINERDRNDLALALATTAAAPHGSQARGRILVQGLPLAASEIHRWSLSRRDDGIEVAFVGYKGSSSTVLLSPEDARDFSDNLLAMIA